MRIPELILLRISCKGEFPSCRGEPQFPRRQVPACGRSAGAEKVWHRQRGQATENWDRAEPSRCRSSGLRELGAERGERQPQSACGTGGVRKSEILEAEQAVRPEKRRVRQGMREPQPAAA